MIVAQQQLWVVPWAQLSGALTNKAKFDFSTKACSTGVAMYDCLRTNVWWSPALCICRVSRSDYLQLLGKACSKKGTVNEGSRYDLLLAAFVVSLDVTS